MGPVIILDKSTLQSLSSDELIFLNKYFIVNIPPVLVMEICGDLSKPDNKDVISKDQVQLLAQKVYRGQTAVNAHFFHCVLVSLLGEKVPMERRILLPGGSPRITESGKKGVVFEETPEQKQLNRWKAGDFNTAEQTISEEWRTASKGIDLELLQRNHTEKFKNLNNITNFTSLTSYVNNYFAHPDSQIDFLLQLIEEHKIPQNFASKIFLRYEQANKPLLKAFAPYAYYCLHIRTFFLLAVIYHLVSTRRTNIIDLEYLYYLPFCMVFSSTDKFQQMMVPFYIQENQRFVPGAVLKADLTYLAQEWDERFQRDMEVWDAVNGNGPPINANSVIYKLWKELFPNWTPGANKNKISENKQERVKELNEYLKGFDKTVALQDTEFLSDDSKIDFIVRRYRLCIDDPCPCGSGKKLKDCHLPEIRKNEKQNNLEKEND